MLCSVWVRPLLVLPRQGLAYFEHFLGDADAAFEAVIGHEMGHLESWDHVLFLPWFCYLVGALIPVATLTSIALVTGNESSFSLGRLLILALLGFMGFYVMRRREAYCDAYAVVLAKSEVPCRRALQALAHGSLSSCLPGSHFHAGERLKLLAERGRAFLKLSGVDLVLFALIYRHPSGLVDSYLNVGALRPPASPVTGIPELFMNFLAVLALAGRAVAERGAPPKRRHLVLAFGLAVLIDQIAEAFQGEWQGNRFYLAAWIGLTFVEFLWGAVLFTYLGL